MVNAPPILISNGQQSGFSLEHPSQGYSTVWPLAMLAEANCTEVHVPVKRFPPVKVAIFVVGSDIATSTVVVTLPPALLLVLVHPNVVGILTLTAEHSRTLNASAAGSRSEFRFEMSGGRIRTLLISCIAILKNAACKSIIVILILT